MPAWRNLSRNNARKLITEATLAHAQQNADDESLILDRRCRQRPAQRVEERLWKILASKRR